MGKRIFQLIYSKSKHTFLLKTFFKPTIVTKELSNFSPDNSLTLFTKRFYLGCIFRGSEHALEILYVSENLLDIIIKIC